MELSSEKWISAGVYIYRSHRRAAIRRRRGLVVWWRLFIVSRGSIIQIFYPPKNREGRVSAERGEDVPGDYRLSLLSGARNGRRGGGIIEYVCV